MAASRVTETLHFQETDLVETASENVDGVAIVRRSLCEIIIELAPPCQLPSPLSFLYWRI